MKLSLGPLRREPKSPKDPEGRMTLYEHIAELRSRVVKAALAVAIFTIVAFIFRNQIYEFLVRPLVEAAVDLMAERPDMDVRPNFPKAESALILMLKLSLYVGLVAACPVWLYQIWSFIVPGLHPHERRWTRVFTGVAAPLFIGGTVLGYFIIPLAMFVVLGFTPPLEQIETGNFIDVSSYLTLVMRLLLVFGIGFTLPVFVVLLNIVGVLSAQRMSKWRSPIIFIIFVFSAVMTPTDPFTMLALAVPMSVLYLAAELVSRMLERNRRRKLDAEDPDLVVRGE